MAGNLLRERSKARRRAAIELSALRLFAADGYDATTVADVAEDAEVSLRTVWTYFPTKRDLVFSRADAAARRLADVLDGQAAGASVLETLGAWMGSDEIITDGETLRLYDAVFAKNPELQPVRGGDFVVAEAALTRALARELGLPEDSAAVRVSRGAIWGVLTEYITGLGSSERAGRREAGRLSLAFLDAGLSAITGT